MESSSGHPYIEGRFLEKAAKKKQYNLLDNSQENICSSNGVYPFCEYEACNGKIFAITNTC